jgi:ABC-type transport system involved in cytochrome c biogenesis permease subunit
MKKYERISNCVARVRSQVAFLVPSLLLNVLLSPAPTYAGDATEWANKMVRVATPIGVAMALFGFLVVGIAHSSHWAAEWAQRREKSAFKGAIFTIGATGLLNLLKSIFA